MQNLISSLLLIIGSISTGFSAQQDHIEQNVVLAGVEFSAQSQPLSPSQIDDNRNSILEKSRVKQSRTQVKSASKHRRMKVSGYSQAKYFYGEVTVLKGGNVEGWIYNGDNNPLYVYGEQTKNQCNLYDKAGRLYQMLVD